MPNKLIYILILLFTVSVAYSQQKSSGYLISGGLYLNGNLYDSKFNQLPGNQKNITSFENGFGIGWTGFAGIIWRPGAVLFGSDFGISLGLSYSDLSASFDKQEFIGHIISPDTYTDGIVSHILETDFKTISIEPSLILSPFSEMPLSFLAGFQVGFPLTTKYEQTEEIISPNNIAFNEEGDRIRQSVSGELPEASSFYFAISAGARYKAWQFGRLEINPEIKFNYGITDMVSAINWKAHSVRAGVTINYDLPKPALIPAAPPPMPLMPEPPLPEQPGKLELAAVITLGGNKINDGDTITINKLVTKSVSEHEIVPVFFFEKDKSEPLNSFIYGGIDSYSFNESLVKEAQNKNIIISAYSTTDEKDGIANKRAEYLKNILIGSGVDSKRISVNIIESNPEGLKHLELVDEYRKAEINIGGDKLLKFRNEIVLFEDFYQTLINVDSKIISDGQKTDFQGVMVFNTGSNVFKTESFNFDIASKMPVNSFTVITSVTDIDSQSVKKEYTFKIKENANAEDIQLNRTENGQYEEHILAYFEFNDTESYAVNDFAIERAKAALSNGKKVMMLPLTDNFGTPEYNDKLATSRANHALRLLGGNNSNIEIVKPENFVFPIDSPYGRMMNRTVIIRIEVE